MTTEEKLKNYILSKHRSIREFTQSIGMPYSTMTTILKKGVNNANVLTIIKICQALNISTDDLAQGKIVPVARSAPEPTKIEYIFDELKQTLLNGDNLTIDGKPATAAEIMMLVTMIDATLQTIKRQRMM